METKNIKKPVLAICYDFDKTLSPDDMQSQGFIPSVGYDDVKKFWEESNRLAEKNGMDQNLAYMYMMAVKSRGKIVFTRDVLKKAGMKIQLYPGVDTWFTRINQYGKKYDVEVEHYIISSGLKEMIEGTSIYKEFKKIYASYYYDKDGVAVWPAQVVNYTNKTQYLFRIEKGTLGVNDSEVNSYFPKDKMRVPFRNMVYIGDSDTDVPCMKLVNINGGYSIGVYNPHDAEKSKVYKMMREQRIRYFAPADYQEGSELDVLIKQIIERTSINEQLERRCYKCEEEMCHAVHQQSEEERRKTELINLLDDSVSFSRTHDIIKKMNRVISWDKEQKERLLAIALVNSQVTYLLRDADVKQFYTKICESVESAVADKIKEKMGI